ncbi:hypothetical protein KJ845_03320 [Patescibacteria group bacterium]|nr:hypothetical protein [Patescibacteria group bacterium]
MENSQINTDLERILKRSQISKDIKDGMGLKHIKEDVRHSQPKQTSSDLIDKFTSEQHVILPEVQATLVKLGEIVQKKYPKITGLSLVPIGSSVNGGNTLRSLLGTLQNSDLDLALLYDGTPPSLTKRTQIQNFLGEQFEIAKANTSLPYRFHLCPVVSISYNHTENLPNTNAALKRLLKASKDNSDHEILLYFYPSFPPEVNRDNLKHIFDALRLLNKISSSKWQSITDTILKRWRALYKIQDKHLGNFETTHYQSHHSSAKNISQSRKLRDQTARSLSKIRISHMEQLLQSTRKK